MYKTLTMKEMPIQERPDEKCLRLGAAALSDAELIGVILRTGAAGEKSTDLAARILNAGPDGLLNLIYLDAADFRRIRGIGEVKAVQLKCVGELARRMNASSRHKNPMFSGPRDIADWYMQRLRHEEKEHLLLVMFDRKSMLLADEIVSVGTSNASLIAPGEIFKSALRHGAEYIVLLHNHPSGNPQPSREDLQVTERISRCAGLLDIPLLDHIIIGDNQYYSFHEQGLLGKGD